MLWKFSENEIGGLEALLQLSCFVEREELLEQRRFLWRQGPFSRNREARGRHSSYNREKNQLCRT